MGYDFLNVIGLMTGTSIDGIDISMVKTNGLQLRRLNKNYYYKYNIKTKKKLINILKEDVIFNLKRKQYLDDFITEQHYLALKDLDILHMSDLIGFHGQTIYHNPDKKISIQLGNPKKLAKKLNKSVIFDFRSKDLFLGGQGAPIAPIYHKLIIETHGIGLPCCFLNIGGVCNLTFWDGYNLIGFDTGPGNGMIDDVMQAEFSLPYDEGGRIAASGNVHQGLVDQMMEEPYFKRTGPRSLDRASFNAILEWPAFSSLPAADKIATLTAFAAAAICHGIKTLPAIPSHIVLAGGGVHNHTLISMIKTFLKTHTRFLLAQDIDADSDFIEAELMAVLGARHHYGLASTFPQTTGVSSPQICGRLAPPR